MTDLLLTRTESLFPETASANMDMLLSVMGFRDSTPDKCKQQDAEDAAEQQALAQYCPARRRRCLYS